MEKPAHDTLNGTFRKRKGFTITCNSVIRNYSLSLKAKGLYSLIRSYITLDDFVLSKSFLQSKCSEGKKAFESAWSELKNTGYLKVHISPSPQGRNWIVQYDLLDEPDIADGIHTYYYNQAGELTETNLSKRGKREGTFADNAESPNRIPQKGVYVQGNHDYGELNNNDDILTLKHKTKNNTYFNHSISKAHEDEVTEADVRDEVIEALMLQKVIPYEYASNRSKMSAAIHYITEWDFRQQHPFHITSEYVDEERMNAFNFCTDCLIDMACATDIRNYRGALISYAKVIDQINLHAKNCAEGSLVFFMDTIVDDFINASQNYNICDIRSYTMSLIWNALITYKIKQNQDLLF